MIRATTPNVNAVRPVDDADWDCDIFLDESNLTDYIIVVHIRDLKGFC